MSDQHPRGVYSQAFDSPSGDEVLLAIDSRGRRVASATVSPLADRYRVRDFLRAILNLVDPVGHRESQEAGERRKGLELIH